MVAIPPIPSDVSVITPAFVSFVQAVSEKDSARARAILDAHPEVATSRYIPQNNEIIRGKEERWNNCITALQVVASYLPQDGELQRRIITSVPVEHRERYLLAQVRCSHRDDGLKNCGHLLERVSYLRPLELLLRHHAFAQAEQILEALPDQASFDRVLGNGNNTDATYDPWDLTSYNSDAPALRFILDRLNDEDLQRALEPSWKDSEEYGEPTFVQEQLANGDLEVVKLLREIRDTRLPHLDMRVMEDKLENDIGDLADACRFITSQLTLPIMLKMMELPADKLPKGMTAQRELSQFLHHLDDDYENPRFDVSSPEGYNQAVHLYRAVNKVTGEYFFQHPVDPVRRIGLVKSLHLPANRFPTHLKMAELQYDWAPLLAEKTVDVPPDVVGGRKGVFIESLTDIGELDEESARQHHCVGWGGYDEKCASGHTHILSVRQRLPDGTIKTLSTAQVDAHPETITDWQKGKREHEPFRIEQHKAYGNVGIQANDPEGLAVSWMLQGLKDGSIPMTPGDALGETAEARERRKKAAGRLVQLIGNYPSDTFIQQTFKEHNERHLRRAAISDKDEHGQLEFPYDLREGRLIEDVTVTGPQGQKVRVPYEQLTPELWLAATGLREKFQDLIRDRFPERAELLEEKWRDQPSAWDIWNTMKAQMQAASYSHNEAAMKHRPSKGFVPSPVIHSHGAEHRAAEAEQHRR